MILGTGVSSGYGIHIPRVKCVKLTGFLVCLLLRNKDSRILTVIRDRAEQNGTPKQKKKPRLDEFGMCMDSTDHIDMNDGESWSCHMTSEHIAESSYFESFIMVCIIINAIALGVVSDHSSQTLKTVVNVIDIVALSVFTVEFGIKVAAVRSPAASYLRFASLLVLLLGVRVRVSARAFLYAKRCSFFAYLSPKTKDSRILTVIRG